LIIEGAYTYDDIPMIDAQYLVLKIRETFSDKIIVKPTVKQKTINKIDLQPFIKKFEESPIDKNTTIVIGAGTQIVAELKYPSLFKEEKYDRIILASHKKNTKNDNESVVRDAFQYTLLKYIDNITVKVNNEMENIKLSQITPKQRCEIINTIPNKMYKEIMQGIESLIEPVTALLEYDEGETISIDQTLLLDI
jgi:hypothetical protein